MNVIPNITKSNIKEFNISDFKTIKGEDMPENQNEYGIDNIRSVLTDTLDIVETIVDVMEDGKITIWEYPKLGGALSGNGFTIVTHIKDAITEALDLTPQERYDLVSEFTERAEKIFTFGAESGKYGTESLERGIWQLQNMINIIVRAAENGIGIEDVTLIPSLASSFSILVTDFANMAKEFMDIQINEGIVLLGIMANKIIDILSGSHIPMPAYAMINTEMIRTSHEGSNRHISI